MKMSRNAYGILLLAVASVPALAQDADPPSRVARLNYLSGAVSFRPGSVDDWTAATLNYPMTTGDHLWTDADARAEMHIGSTAIRMDSTTAMSILALDDAVAQISLTEGTIDVRLRYMAEGDIFEVDTPNAAIVLRRAGDYRISTRGDDNLTMAATKAGEASIRAGGNEFPLLTGQGVRLAGQDTVTQELGPLPAPDDFEVWCQTRDRREAGTVSARYVPRETIGYEDLDQYGVWRMDPRYGWVWVPQGMPAGWAPYHYGHWAWVEPWGWTWIDDAPWGFAPFHYGRWAFTGFGWAWVPGSMEAAVGVVRVRPVYAPALVVFVGGGEFGVGAALGGGAGMAAWFPLGPGEVYRPAYRVSAAYVTNINIVSVRNVAPIGSVEVNVRYANQAVPGAMMVVPHDAFVNSRRVSEVAVVVPREQIVRARAIGFTAPMAPVRESVIARPGDAVVRVPPQSLVARQVVVAHQPPPPPVKFADKERALQSNGGRPLDPGQVNSLRRNAPDRNPLVRTPNPPAGGGARRPEAVRPEATRPPANDRPPTARPAVNPQPEVRPAEARPAETRPIEAKPAEQKPVEAAPAAHPAEKKAPPKKRSEQTQKK
jgi:hypothetical protein